MYTSLQKPQLKLVMEDLYRPKTKDSKKLISTNIQEILSIKSFTLNNKSVNNCYITSVLTTSRLPGKKEQLSLPKLNDTENEDAFVNPTVFTKLSRNDFRKLPLKVTSRFFNDLPLNAKTQIVMFIYDKLSQIPQVQSFVQTIMSSYIRPILVKLKEEIMSFEVIATRSNTKTLKKHNLAEVWVKLKATDDIKSSFKIFISAEFGKSSIVQQYSLTCKKGSKSVLISEIEEVLV